MAISGFRLAGAPDRRRLRFPLAVALVLGLSLIAGCAARPRPARTPDAEPGRAHFDSYCAACHQYDGQGVGAAPPLDGSSWVTGPEERLIRIVLHGVRGAMQVQGKIYNREMPGFGKILSDADIASLLSFVRERFGGIGAPVTPEVVARVRAATQHRKDYWSVDELLDVP